MSRVRKPKGAWRLFFRPFSPLDFHAASKKRRKRRLWARRLNLQKQTTSFNFQQPRRSKAISISSPLGMAGVHLTHVFPPLWLSLRLPLGCGGRFGAVRRPRRRNANQVPVKNMAGYDRYLSRRTWHAWLRREASRRLSRASHTQDKGGRRSSAV
jgi:hypothetical protein